MSDTAVEFPLSVLNKLLVYHNSDQFPVSVLNKLRVYHNSDQTGDNDTEKQIKSLQRDLRLFKAFLNATVNKRRKDEHVKALGTKIHDVVYELEDELDVFDSQAMEEKKKGIIVTIIMAPRLSILEKPKPAPNLHTISRKVNDVRGEVERYWQRPAPISNHGDEDGYGKSEVRRPREAGVVGFTDVTKELIRRLTEETNYFDVVSLIGMHGLGKTTLAWKIFNDPEIVYRFPTRIWLRVSEELSEKDIFLSILKTFVTINEDIRRKDNLEIAGMVNAYLEGGRFLIVLDDVWNPTDWEALRIAIPKDNKSKILITSSDDEVGNYASNPRPPVKLRFFNSDECWELLQLEALGKLECPQELKKVGQQIARDCRGLPLSVVAIGGILAEKILASNIIATKKAWKEISKSVGTYINEDARNIKFLRRSYDNLPNHLRSCFLYFGMFPQVCEIPVSKLICMWIGEGFIQPKLDRSLEETAQMYLEELINRNLVSICKVKADGEVKTCMIHGIFREFFRIQAEDENFLHEIKNVRTSNISKYRRVCIHSNWLEFISSKPVGPCVRSFVSFSKDKCDVTRKNSSNIIGAFKLLRVLDVSPFQFTKIDSDFYSLLHIRYIALSCDWPVLPWEFIKLWNIQTLLVDTTSRTLVVKVDIWNMRDLRHFKTTATAILPKPTPESKHGAELQTLGTISVKSFTTQLCERAPNLKKLGIRGRLGLFFERRIGSIDSLGKMEHLGKLKLINDVYPKPAIEGRLHRLPVHDQFPSGLTSLTLCCTFLSWDHMYTLTLLKKLEVLKLKDNAFIGDTWEVQCGGFQSLKYLLIQQTDLAFWRASPLSYPKLTSLVLKNCEKLCEIPIELADVPTLRMLELYCCPFAAESARMISEAKQETPAGGRDFNFSII